MIGLPTNFRDNLYMTNKIIKLVLIGSVLLLFGSCTNSIGTDVNDNDKPIELQLQIDAMFANSAGLKAQGSAPSINADGTDREDYVDNLYLLVFDQTSSVQVFAEELTTFSPTVKIPKPGTYSFYFIANCSTSLEDVKKYSQTDLLDTFLHTHSLDFTDYQGVKGNPAVKFPMCRVYTGQEIGYSTAGGAQIFKPTLPPVILSPVSSYGADYSSTPELVTLVRSVAKISVNFLEGAKFVEKVELLNARAEYTLIENNATSLKYDGATERPWKTGTRDFGFDAEASDQELVIYVPEMLTQISNSVEGDEKVINFIKVTLKDGTTKKFPVVSAFDGPTTGIYMKDVNTPDIARPQFNVIRNHHYKYQIKLSPSSDIDVNLQVLPWDYVTSEYSYKRPVYEITVKSPDGTVKSDIKQEVNLLYPQSATISFKISQPIGQRWAASITNAMYFDLKIVDETTGKDVGDGDIVSSTTKSYTMTITPKAPFHMAPRYTQFLIAIDGKEIYLGGENRFLRDGEAVEWRFKQVMP